MIAPLSLQDCKEHLQDIARDVGLGLLIGGSCPGDVIGAPPASAHLVRVDGLVSVWIDELAGVEHVEQVLHEMAHHALGSRMTIIEECAAFEWAAVRALRMPDDVAAEVARMAKGALP